MNAIGIGLLLWMASDPSVAQRKDGIRSVAWLQGAWERITPQQTVEEQWLAPRGNTMIGVGRTVKGDSLIEYELIILRARGADLVYEAHPSGQAPAEFRSRSVTDHSVVFENLQHDFPQRVGYELRGADSLIAWIEGPRDGKTQRIEFPYRRLWSTTPRRTQP